LISNLFERLVNKTNLILIEKNMNKIIKITNSKKKEELLWLKEDSKWNVYKIYWYKTVREECEVSRIEDIYSEKQYMQRDYELSNIFNTTKTKSDLYDKIIKYLTKEWFIKDFNS
jgi:hypothetical protein